MDAKDFYISYRFAVHRGHDMVGGFSEVSGLMVETEVEPLREGGGNDAEIQLPGPTKYASRLVLKRGVASSAQLWAWYVAALSGQFLRHELKITLLDYDGPADSGKGLSWTFVEACPVKWTGPELRADSSTVAFESIELIHKGILLAGAGS